jgi:hypothetical protein
MEKKIFALVRSPVGSFFKYLFIVFNFLMIFWLISYWTTVSKIGIEDNAYASADAAIGSMIGTGMILMSWGIGVIITGIPVLLTRGIIQEYTYDEYKILKEKNNKTKLVLFYVFCAFFVLFNIVSPKKDNIKSNPLVNSSSIIKCCC